MYFKFYETSADRYLETLPIDISEDLAAEEAEMFQGAIIFEAELTTRSYIPKKWFRCEKDDVVWAESSDENEVRTLAEDEGGLPVFRLFVADIEDEYEWRLV